MGRGRIASVVLAASVAAALLLASTAQGAFHLMKIREVHTGGATGGSYVVLQMYEPGQNEVANHKVLVYDAGGSVAHTFTFSSKVANGASQATILVAGSGYATAFPSGPSPDATDASLDLPPAAGAVCFESIDCVSWGSFTWGANPQPSPTGTPVSSGGVTPGEALHRLIAPGCPTLLEFGDDTNDSATDFSETTPNPRANSSPIVEKACTAPTTTIDSGPAKPTNATNASFTYHSTPGGASFECKLDAEAFVSCEPSGQSYGGPLSEGSHTFQVRATNANGTGSPASYSWTIDQTAPIAEILGKPPEVTPETSASFTYKSSEVGSTFECSLAVAGKADAFGSCPLGGKTYEGLEDMTTYVFKVCATDKAGNQGELGEGECDEYEWEVNSTAVDETPPQTTIVVKPPNPSGSSTAFFFYESTEPGSTFECRLDSAPFEACSPLGKTYAGLASGTHTFEVRARDESGNPDPTPAGYTFDVVLATPPPPLPPPPPGPKPEPGTPFAAGTAEARGAFVLLRMGCRGQPGARCKGSLRLLARVGIARSSRSATRNVVIGGGRYNLPAGSRGRVVRAKLTAKGRRLVRRAGRRGLKVSLVGKRLEKRVLTLRGAAKGRRTRR